MTAAVNIPELVASINLVHSIIDDFHSEDTARWTTTATDSGTSTVGDSRCGVMALAPSDGTVADNDEVYLQTKEVFKVQSGKPILFSAYVQFSEANTDDANVFVGLMDAPTANALVDDGGGPKASFSGAGFYKIDGGTRWNIIYSDGATQTKAELTAAISLDHTAQTAGGSAYQLLEFEIVPITTTTCDVNFKINGVNVYSIRGATYASATEMAVAFGLKNGGANQETLNIDWVTCIQKR